MALTVKCGEKAEYVHLTFVTKISHYQGSKPTIILILEPVRLFTEFIKTSETLMSENFF